MGRGRRKGIERVYSKVFFYLVMVWLFLVFVRKKVILNIGLLNFDL